MTLYLYRIGTAQPVLCMEPVKTYTADSVTLEDGRIYAPLSEDCELSSLPDCRETLRKDWRETHADTEERVAQLEDLMAALLFGGDAA